MEKQTKSPIITKYDVIHWFLVLLVVGIVFWAYPATLQDPLWRISLVILLGFDLGLIFRKILSIEISLDKNIKTIANLSSAQLSAAVGKSHDDLIVSLSNQFDGVSTKLLEQDKFNKKFNQSIENIAITFMATVGDIKKSIDNIEAKAAKLSEQTQLLSERLSKLEN